MTATAKLQTVSSKPTTTFEDKTVKTTTSQNDCILISMVPVLPQTKVPPKHSSIGDLVTRWEQDNERRTRLEEARQWFADTFHAGEKDTIRTMRLRKGMSQAQLAEKIGTSQSHIARIERGTENVHIETCRRLCEALQIDMNTLDHALRQQEAIAQLKTMP